MTRPGAATNWREHATVTLRGLLLALVVLGAAGLVLDLLLLEHFESAWQWTPIALLVGVLGSAIAVARWPGRRALRTMQALMALCVVAGFVGIYLHLRGNVEFEQEQDPDAQGLALFWEAIRGATPALAPAALSQLGLLGLVFAFRHPALRQPTPIPASDAATNTEHPR